MPTNPPFLTIIIPTLNEEGVVGHLLEDINNQTNQDFQVIIVDAKSSDGTIAEINQTKGGLDLNIVESDQKNVCYQRNLGASKANTKWVLFSDADNRLPPYFIQGIRYQIDKHHPKYLSTYCTTDGNNPKDTIIASIINTYIDIQRNTPMPYLLESMVVFDKDFYLQMNGFDESLPFGEGNDFARRAKSKGVTLQFAKDPTYTFSLRRLRKEGTLKIVRSYAQIEAARLLNIDIDKKISQKLYPMKGGSYFKTESTQANQQVERIISLFSKLKHLPENLQSSLKDTLKDLI